MNFLWTDEGKNILMHAVENFNGYAQSENISFLNQSFTILKP